MIYFGYPLDIHGWKTKPETEPDWFRGPEPENRGWKTIPKPEPAEPETRGYPPQTRSVAILIREASSSVNEVLQLVKAEADRWIDAGAQGLETLARL